MRELIERIDRLYEGSTEKPWAWWNTGDKDNSFQIGLMADKDGKLVGGDCSADNYGEDEEQPTFIEEIAEYPSGVGVPLATPALICELVNNWPTIRAALCQKTQSSDRRIRRGST